MKITRTPTTLTSKLTVDKDLDFGGDWQVADLASPASGEALRKGNQDIKNAEVADAAEIVYSKLKLDLGIVNTDIALAAAIIYSKLNLTGRIKAADIEDAAGIPLTKLEDTVCSETELAAALPKIKAETRAGGAESGDVSYTGYGFTPTGLIIQMYGAAARGSIGCSDPAKGVKCFRSNSYTGVRQESDVLVNNTNGTYSQKAFVKTYDEDGFTLTWAKSGTPPGTLLLTVFAFK